MIPQKYKDQVAKNYSQFTGQPYKSWQEMEEVLKCLDIGFDSIIQRLEEAAELYANAKAEAKWNECHTKVKEELEYMFSVAGGTVSAHYLFKHLPKPEFKP